VPLRPGLPALRLGVPHPAAASLGLAILGTILVTELRNHVTSSLVALGLPPSRAAEAANLSQSHAGSGSVASIPHFFRVDFAQSTQTVLYVMAGIMAVAAIVAFVGLRGGVQQEPAPAAAGEARRPTDAAAAEDTVPGPDRPDYPG
jgi:hypothetical protein